MKPCSDRSHDFRCGGRMTRFYYVKAEVEGAREVGVLRLCDNHLQDVRKSEQRRGVQLLDRHVITKTKEEAERLLLVMDTMDE